MGCVCTAACFVCHQPIWLCVILTAAKPSSKSVFLVVMVSPGFEYLPCLLYYHSSRCFEIPKVSILPTQCWKFMFLKINFLVWHDWSLFDCQLVYLWHVLPFIKRTKQALQFCKQKMRLVFLYTVVDTWLTVVFSH